MIRITISTRTALVLLVLAVLAIPATAFATHIFADVSDSSVHAEGIEFMKDSGVSVGCQDGTVYCPDDPVTRAQMGTFMYRLSGNDPATAPSVNADRVDGLDAEDLQPRWALIAADGTVVAQSGGISVANSDSGFYYLNIGSSVAGKGIFVSSSDMDQDFGGTVLAAPCGGGVDGTICPPFANNTNHVFVFTSNQTNDGGLAHAFYIMVLP